MLKLKSQPDLTMPVDAMIIIASTGHKISVKASREELLHIRELMYTGHNGLINILLDGNKVL